MQVNVEFQESDKKKKIKRIIAREGLILIGLAIILYFPLLFIPKDIPAIFPKYRAEFTNGEIYIIAIYPDYYYATDTKTLMRDFFNPKPKIIEKRLNEFIKRENIKSSLKEAKFINSRQVYLSKMLYTFLSLNLFMKAVFTYLILLLIRFILWAIKTLKEK